MSITITVDGRQVTVDHADSLAVALLNADIVALRASITGEPRGPLCGMGICFECRVRVDGRSHVRSCLEPLREGMEVVTRE